MINITVGELVNASEPLQKLAKKEVKARLALTIGRMLKEIEREIANFNEARMNLIRKYGETDENNELITDEKGSCTIKKEYIKTFNEELKELTETEIEINGNKLNLDDLENLDFTPVDMAILEPLIET